MIAESAAWHFIIILRIFMIWWNGPASVSYTHLDVYKRQSSRSVVMKDTVYFIVISLIMVVMAYFVAFGCEKLIEQQTHVKFSSEKTKVNKLGCV